MRPIRWLPLALLACADLLVFHVEQSAETVVEGAGALGVLLDTLSFAGFSDFDVTVDEELANQGVADEDIDAARLTGFTLSTPDADDLSFLEDFAVYVSAEGLAETRVAHADEFPEGEARIELTLDDVDLAPFIVAPAMRITTRVTGSAPVDDTTVRADVSVEIEATATGACNAAREG